MTKTEHAIQEVLKVGELRISEDDEMLLYLQRFFCPELASVHYFCSGSQMMEVFRGLVERFHRKRLREIRFLDFASGHKGV